MQTQPIALLISLTLHVIVVGIVTKFHPQAEAVGKPLVFDLVSIKNPEAPAGTRLATPVIKPLPKPLSAKSPVSADTVYGSPGGRDSAQPNIARNDVLDDGTEGGMPSRIVFLPPPPSPTPEETRKRYTAENFRYIGELIGKHTVYPRAAEEMEISGTAIVQFNVKADGSVGQVILTASSGSRILDTNAMATILRSGPFPRPAIPVSLTFPVRYSLER